MMWTCNGLSIEDSPFQVVHKETRECQFGPHYFKKRERTSSRICLQGTRKIKCPATIQIHEYKYYPEYAVTEKHTDGPREIRVLHEERLRSLKQALLNGDIVQTKTKYFVSLPTNESHENTHPTGVISGPAQKVHPLLSKKIEDLVREGAVDANEIQRSLREFVKNQSAISKPSFTDRAYYPTVNDIRNHMYKAKLGLQLSKFDQENLTLKMKEWDVQNSEDKHLFRPYIKSDDDAIDEHSDMQFDQTLLWVYQQKWQKDVLTRYGNQISLIDATYRTMKYELPLFFICVRTNVGYSVVAQFIVQSESIEHITEALNVLKVWNPTWNPRFFLSDFSDAEISAIEEAFPTTTVYGCDFHREQAWTRWVQDRKNGLDKSEADCLLDLLRACAWAPPGPDEANVDIYYQEAVSLLKQSVVWKKKKHVQNWLIGMWLCHPQVHRYDLALKSS